MWVVIGQARYAESFLENIPNRSRPTPMSSADAAGIELAIAVQTALRGRKDRIDLAKMMHLTQFANPAFDNSNNFITDGEKI